MVNKHRKYFQLENVYSDFENIWKQKTSKQTNLQKSERVNKLINKQINK